MSLFDEWQEAAYDRKKSKEEVESYWKDLFDKEKSVYEVMLDEPDTVIEGTVGELAERFSISPVEMVGILDGMNTSLNHTLELESLEESTHVSLAFDKVTLYRNMVDADAEWLYGLPQWDNIFDKETKRRLFKEEKQSKIAHAPKKIGRNEPCPCGSGKKYKFCHGRKGAEPLPEDLLEGV